MSIQKDGQTYYTSDEVKAKLRDSIKIKADKVVKKIKNEVTTRDSIHV